MCSARHQHSVGQRIGNIHAFHAPSFDGISTAAACSPVLSVILTMLLTLLGCIGEVLSVSCDSLLSVNLHRLWLSQD